MDGHDEQERDPEQRQGVPEAPLIATGPTGAHALAMAAGGLALLLIAVWRCG